MAAEILLTLGKIHILKMRLSRFFVLLLTDKTKPFWDIECLSELLINCLLILLFNELLMIILLLYTVAILIHFCLLIQAFLLEEKRPL